MDGKTDLCDYFGLADNSRLVWPRPVRVPQGYPNAGLWDYALVNAMLIRVAPGHPAGTSTSRDGSASQFVRRHGYEPGIYMGGRYDGDDAGHLLPNQLGGRGEAESVNLYPQHFEINRGWNRAFAFHRRFEEDLAREVHDWKKKVCLLIRPDYALSFGRPNRPQPVFFLMWGTNLRGGVFPGANPDPV
jgi:hypothetical protein